MPKKRLIILTTAVVIFLVLAAAIGLLILRRQPAASLPSLGPTVLITSPGPGDNSQAAPSIEIQAAAYGDNPIHHLELWLDGGLAQTYYNPDPGKPAPLQISFDLILSSGNHLLFVRAVDTHNLIGQSLPITAQGSSAFAGVGPFSLVQIQAGDSLEDTLAANGTDLASILPFNPGLGSGASPGTTIALPIQPNEDNPPAGQPAQPPANPTILDWIKLLPIGNPPLRLIPVQVMGPPSAPSSLQANITDCTITLNWTDTSDNEAGFNIWVTGLGLPPRVAARTQAAKESGPVSLELPALGLGDFVYWVEAYNIAGAQPGPQALVSIADPCPNQLAGTITLETLDFSGPAQYDKAYCYVSLQDNPEIRLPAGKDQFIPLASGQGDFTSLPAASRSFKLADPGEQVLKVNGECWGWSGATLTKLGFFNQSLAQAQWNGSRIPLSGGLFEVGVRITRDLVSGDLVTFAAPDPGIAAPRILSFEAPINLGDVGLDPMDAINYLGSGNLRTLVWEWFPLAADSPQPTGFTVLVNGIPFKQILSPTDRSTEIRVPAFCGTKLEISLVANLDANQSLPSNSVTDQQPDCTLYAVVDFEQVRFGWTNDSLNPSNRCDTLQSYFNISVTEIFDRDDPAELVGRKQIKRFGGGSFFMEVRCGYYNLDDLAGPYYAQKELHPTQITIPLRPLEGHSTQYLIEAAMWDSDWGGDDLIARFNGSFHITPGMVEGLINQMSGSPKMIEDYYCDSYIATFNGDAKSAIDVCVDIYADDPSTGASTVPSNAPLPESTVDAPIIAGAVKLESDLNLVDLYIDQTGYLYLRVRNDGPVDLVRENLNLTASIQTDDPTLYGLPWTTKKFVTLKQGARTDLRIPHQQLDPTQYSYTITVEATAERSSDPDPGNNQITTAFTASALQTYPDLLDADLQITAIKADGSGKLRVELLNGGPDIITTSLGSLICEATQVSRRDGTSTKITGLEIAEVLNLDAGQKHQLYPVKEGFEFNQLLYWYILSCQVQSGTEFSDPNPANNFLTETVQ